LVLAVFPLYSDPNPHLAPYLAVKLIDGLYLSGDGDMLEVCE